MTDEDASIWAGLFRQFPEAGVAGIVLFAVLGLGVNFAWWLVALPDLIDAHSNSWLYAAFFGSLGMVLLDTVLVVRALRWANRLDAGKDTKEITDGNES